MRSLALVALLGVAASASAWVKNVLVSENGPGYAAYLAQNKITVWLEVQVPEGQPTNRGRLVVGDGRTLYELTKSEAASLGRALLEAAGETEKSFDELAEDVACDTDLRLSADPNLHDAVRKVIMESVKRCRTRRQEKALDRISERLGK